MTQLLRTIAALAESLWPPAHHCLCLPLEQDPRPLGICTHVYIRNIIKNNKSQSLKGQQVDSWDRTTALQA